MSTKRLLRVQQSIMTTGFLFMLTNYGVDYMRIKSCEYKNHQIRPNLTSQRQDHQKTKQCAQKQNSNVTEPTALNVLHISGGQNCCRKNLYGKLMSDKGSPTRGHP